MEHSTKHRRIMKTITKYQETVRRNYKKSMERNNFKDAEFHKALFNLFERRLIS